MVTQCDGTVILPQHRRHSYLTSSRLSVGSMRTHPNRGQTLPWTSICVTIHQVQNQPRDILSKSLISEGVEDWVPERVDEDAMKRQDIQLLGDRRGFNLDEVVDDVGEPAGYKHSGEETNHD